MEAIKSAQYGMMSASNQLDTTAASLAKGTPLDPTTVMNVVQAKTAFTANAAVMKAADRMTGALLDIKA
jgi:hypothetical protein